MKIKKILIVIPSYNCEKQIKRVINKLNKNLKTIRGIKFTILIIDNVSKDNTLSESIKSIKKISSNNQQYLVIKNKKNYGLGGSQKIGFKFAYKNRFNFTIVLHGDDQADSNDIKKFMKILNNNNNIDAILGSRFLESKRIKQYSLLRKIANFGLNYIYSIYLNKNISDLGSGLNLFKVNKNLINALDNFSSDCAFNVYLLIYLVKNKTKIIWSSISWDEFDQISNANNIKIGLQILYILIKDFFNITSKFNQKRTYKIIFRK